jgi:hypothetical protein
MRHIRLSFMFVSAASAHAAAQATSASRPADTACSYQACALSIAPAWDGLRVVRGSAGQRVANLHFFWPSDIDDVLRGSDGSVIGADSAGAHARRAVQLRWAGAGFTDAGALAIGAAVLRAIGAGHVSKRSQVIAGVGLGALVISVPLQFAADGELSRAIWWHNLRYAHPPGGGVVTLGTTPPVVRQQVVSLAGTWDVEYTLDSSGTQSPVTAVRRVRGRLMFGDVGIDSAFQGRVPTNGASAFGRFVVDFTPLFGASLGRDIAAAAAGPVDSTLANEAAGTLANEDSVQIDLVPRIAAAGVSMAGRIRGDSVSGTWIRRAACCGELGHFRMSRVDRTPVVFALPAR